jgi:hypothetical protein
MAEGGSDRLADRGYRVICRLCECYFTHPVASAIGPGREGRALRVTLLRIAARILLIPETRRQTELAVTVKRLTKLMAILWLMAALSLVGWLIVNLDTAGWILVLLTTGLMTFELTRRPARVRRAGPAEGGQLVSIWLSATCSRRPGLQVRSNCEIRSAEAASRCARHPSATRRRPASVRFASESNWTGATSCAAACLP